MNGIGIRWLSLLLMLATLTPAAWAHKSSDSYLSLRVDSKHIDGQWDIALRDLDFAIGLDDNSDGELTWGEVRAHHPDITAYALARLGLTTGDTNTDCPLTLTRHTVDQHSDGTYAVLHFKAICPLPIETLTVHYRLLFDLDRQHKGLLYLNHAGQTSSTIFTPTTETQSFTLATLSLFDTFADYLVEGIWHIGIGIDHILFLLSLLIPAVLTFQQHRWQPVTTFREGFIEVVKVVTAFTLAHSITLTLATLEVVQLPSRWVESVIALSVVLAALNNLRPTILRGRWIVAFAFGLIHGFGFASVLADLGLPQNALLIALVAFNLGVEVGQLAIAGVFLPLAHALRRTPFYRQIIVTGGSFGIALMAALWFVERAFLVQLLPT